MFMSHADVTCVNFWGYFESATPFLGVLHVMWGAWYVDYLWLYYDGHSVLKLSQLGRGRLGRVDR